MALRKKIALRRTARCATITAGDGPPRMLIKQSCRHPTIREIVLDTLHVRAGIWWFKEHRTFLESYWRWAKDLETPADKLP